VTGEAFKQLMVEAAKVFGPISTWDAATRQDVARWTKKTVDGICGGTPLPERPVRPLWTDPEPVELNQWDELGRL